MVHYEDLKTDLEGQVLRILQYLKLQVDEVRLRCALAEPNNQYKRRKVDMEDPFGEELHALIERSMTRVQGLLAQRKLQLLPVRKYKWVRVKEIELP